METAQGARTDVTSLQPATKSEQLEAAGARTDLTWSKLDRVFQSLVSCKMLALHLVQQSGGSK